MPSTSQAQNLAQRILSEWRNGRSYRVIAEDFPRREDGSQIVKPGTINRIAKSGGVWLPQNEEILIALGLKRPVGPKEKLPEWLRRIKRKIAGMAKKTKNAVLRN